MIDKYFVKSYSDMVEEDPDYLKKLIEWFENRSYKDFKTGVVHQATSEEDFEYFKSIICDRHHLVRYGELMILDVYGNELWLCEVTRRKHKLKKSGRVVKVKALMQIIPDC